MGSSERTCGDSTSASAAGERDHGRVTGGDGGARRGIGEEVGGRIAEAAGIARLTTVAGDAVAVETAGGA